MNLQILPSSISRLLAGIALLVAFVIMASVFVPGRIEAQDDKYWPRPIDRVEQHETADEFDVFNEHSSTDPHEGLPMLGTLEFANHIVHIYATDFGARYSVYERTTGGEVELGVLLSVEQMSEHFPDLPLNSVEDSSDRLIMFAPPNGVSEWE